MTALEIEAFLTIVHTGSFSSASEKLFVTQPALSRRITALEKKIGYELFIRGKGIRAVELTNEGRAFLPLAEKWIALWKDTYEIGDFAKRSSLSLSSVGSVITYLLPNVFKAFMVDYPECHLDIHNYHSYESYTYVESGEVDLAFISNPYHFVNTLTVPAFKETMRLITTQSLVEPVSPDRLDPGDEIRLPWSPEYDLWHEFWYKPTARSRVQLDHITLVENFLDDSGTWLIAPTYVADQLSERVQLNTYRMTQPPQDILIYHLTKKNHRNPYVTPFLNLLKKELEGLEGIQSYL